MCYGFDPASGVYTAKVGRALASAGALTVIAVVLLIAILFLRERIVREQSGTDVARDEERSFLLMYLREFASPDGLLPVDFDAVVRESFGDTLDAIPW